MNYDEDDLEDGVEPSDLTYEEGKTYRNWELEQIADNLLRADSRRELCRQCDEYGDETGNVESQPQEHPDGGPLVDDTGAQLYVDFPELQCPNGHVWYKGEGKNRGNGGKDPVLFEEHLKNRQRREIYTTVGTPDPSIVMGMFNRTHPQGRKVNSADQRRRHGASFYRIDAIGPLVLLVQLLLNDRIGINLSLGILCLLMLSVLLERLICASTTRNQRIAKRNVHEIEDMLPQIG